MARTISWAQSLRAKQNALNLMLAAAVILGSVASLYALSVVERNVPTMALMTENRYRYPLMLHLANQLVDAKSDGERRRLRVDLDKQVDELNARLPLLEKGDPAIDAMPPSDPEIIENVRTRLEDWRARIKPILMERITENSTRDKAQADLDALDREVREQIDHINTGVKLSLDDSRERASRVRWLLVAKALILLAVIGAAHVVGRSVIKRVGLLADAADRAAAGDLTVKTNLDGQDEVAALGAAFDTMTGNLRTNIESEKKRRERTERLLAKVREATSKLSSATAEILASTAQQAAGAQEQAAAVAQTVTTVEQVA
ncbi:MAG: HAMP domain-containing protein, partial [Isosphaeraceae bacterium]|nr:HAMP domain-containing protein [Isosphaeraceae bacterium]